MGGYFVVATLLGACFGFWKRIPRSLDGGLEGFCEYIMAL